MRLFTILTFLLVGISASHAQIHFNPTVNLSNLGLSSNYQNIVAQGRNFYLVWENIGEIYFKKSENAGASWSPNLRISPSGISGGWPAVAVSDSNVYVAYHNSSFTDIYFQYSHDHGGSWSGIQNISSSPVTSQTPQLAASGDTVLAVWEDRSGVGSSYVIHGTVSFDGGISWTTPVALTDTTRSSRWVQLRYYDGVIHLIWIDIVTSGARGPIMHRSSSDFGITWSPAINITPTDGNSTRINMFVKEGAIYVVSASGGVNAREILFLYSNDGGASWSLPQNVSNNPGDSKFPNIWAEAHGDTTDRLYLVWYDRTGFTQDEILFSYSIDSGENWEPAMNLSENSDNSYRPQVVAYSAQNRDSLCVVWYDYSLGPSEILSRSGYYDAPVGVQFPPPLSPDRVALYPNHPNPFNAGTVIRYSLSEAGEIELTIFNLLGEKVVTLWQGKQSAGEHSLRWDGTDVGGMAAPSGVYLLRLKSAKFVRTQKLLLLR